MAIAPSLTRRCRALACAIASLAPALPSLSAAGDGAALAALSWKRVWLPDGGGPAVALARDPQSDRVAFADDRGAWLREPGGRFRRVLRRDGARDLAFTADGALLVATTRGLYAVGRDGWGVDRSPRPGAAARTVERVAAAAGAVAVATGAGVFLSPDARSWQPLRGPIPRTRATAVALRSRGRAVEVWLAAGGELWRSAAQRASDRAADAFRVDDWQRLVSQGATSDTRARDIVLDLPGAEVAVVFARTLVVRVAPESPWRTLRPGLPPGAAAQRLLHAAGRYWLATDRGLLHASSLDGPWRRAEPPAGAATVNALVAGAGELYAATAAGLLEGRLRARARAAEWPARRERELAVGPSIRAVQRATLKHLGLHAAAIDRLRQRVARRGWLPTLDLRVSHKRKVGTRDERDEAFISGAMRRLHDRDTDDSRDLDLGVTLSWDLGDAAFHPEEIDVSREARALIALRDDVLDEVTQLYFERRRLLVQLAAEPDPRAARAEELALRVDELGAGIDAWTGGWFGRAVSGGER